MTYGRTLRSILFTLTVLFFPSFLFFRPSSGHAQATPSSLTQSTASPGGDDASLLDKLKQIQILKEKIATKVAEIREKDQMGKIGKVRTVGKSSLTILTSRGEETVTFSDDVVVYSLVSKKKESQISEISPGDTVAAIGNRPDGASELAARFLYIHSLPLQRIGKIADVNRTDYTITVRGNQGETVVDIEKFTRTFAYLPEKGEFVRSGFSKLSVGETVHVRGAAHETEANRMSANQIFSFSFSPSASEAALEPSPSPSSPPSVSAADGQ